MKEFIIADNQELTRYALEHLIGEGKDSAVYVASNRAGVVKLLTLHPGAVVILDYTLFDFQDEDQLLIVAERFSLSEWILFSDELAPQFVRRVGDDVEDFSFQGLGKHTTKIAIIRIFVGSWQRQRPIPFRNTRPSAKKSNAGTSNPSICFSARNITTSTSSAGC